MHQNSYVGAIPGPEGNQHPILTPFGVFAAADGFVSIAAPTDEWWQKICRLIDREDLLSDESLKTNALRTKNRDRVYGIVEAFTRTRSKKQLLEIFGGKVPFGPVYDMATTASKLIATGLPFADTIDAITLHPRETMGLTTVPGIGDKADFTVFRLEDCNQPVADSLGNSMVLTRMLEPVGTVIGASWQDAARRLE